MRPLPLNLLTLYADLVENMPDGVPPGSISRRLEGGKRRLYASIKVGGTRRQLYLGTAGDPRAEAAASAHRRAAAEARTRRKTVSVLKRAGVPSPPIAVGRVLEALASAGLFEKGAVLIGTCAFQLYAPVVGASLASSALTTQDADIALARLAVAKLRAGEPLIDVLKRADASFAPAYAADDKLPKAFRSEAGFAVDVVTTKGRSADPLQIRALACAATPLKFLDYLIEDPIEVVALYGAGVKVRVPDPPRYAVHKLIVARERKRHDLKSAKDVTQARELIAALDLQDAMRIDDAFGAAIARGRSWKTALERGLQAAKIVRS